MNRGPEVQATVRDRMIAADGLHNLDLSEAAWKAAGLVVGDGGKPPVAWKWA